MIWSIVWSYEMLSSPSTTPLRFLVLRVWCLKIKMQIDALYFQLPSELKPLWMRFILCRSIYWQWISASVSINIRSSNWQALGSIGLIAPIVLIAKCQWCRWWQVIKIGSTAIILDVISLFSIIFPPIPNKFPPQWHQRILSSIAPNCNNYCKRSHSFLTTAIFLAPMNP